MGRLDLGPVNLIVRRAGPLDFYAQSITCIGAARVGDTTATGPAVYWRCLDLLSVGSLDRIEIL